MSDKQNAQKAEKLLCYPLANTLLAKLQTRLASFNYTFEIIKVLKDVEKISPKDLPRIALVELDPDQENENAQQIVTQIRKLSSVMKIIGIFHGKLNYNPESLIKKGFNFVYQIPFEEEILINSIFEFAPVDLDNDSLTLDVLSRVNVIEIEWSKALPFDLFVCLPTNKKVIQYRQKGQELDTKSLEKFKHHKEYALYIKKTDLSSYYSYSAQVLSRLQNDSNLSRIEKEKKITGEVKKIMSSLFSHPSADDKEGIEMLENVRKVLVQLEDSSGSKKQFSNTLAELAAQNMTNYTHCRNVATYCALFGLALGVHEPETLQMGGFLHDIGMSDLPPDLLTKDWEQMTQEEKDQYRLHPGSGAMTVKFKKMKLPTGVMNMITQHHERQDGSGFPYGYTSDKIDILAKICAFADEFDHLTSMRFGHKTRTPAEAIKQLAGLDGNPPSLVYEEKIFKPLVIAFLEEFGEEIPEHLKEAAPLEATETAPQALEQPKVITVTSEPIKTGKVTVVEKVKQVTTTAPTPLFAQDITPLIDSIKAVDLDGVQRLLKTGIDVNIRSSDGSTALIMALKSGKRDIAKAVLRSKADMNVCDLDEKTPLMHAIESNNFEMFNLLLVHAFESSFVPGATPMQSVGGKTWASNVLDINLVNKLGENALMVAARIGNDQMFESLIDAGANLYIKNQEGLTVLDVATAAKHNSIIETINRYEKFLNQGADAFTKDEPTPEEKPVAGNVDVKARDKSGQTPLMQFAAIGNEDMVKKLIQLKSEIDAKNFSGETALMLACRKGNPKIVQLLLTAKANPLLKDGQGKAPIIHAVETGSTEVIRPLLESGAKLDAKYLGSTPLMISCLIGNLDMVKILIDCGANPAEKDTKGKHPIAHARAKGHHAIVDFLESLPNNPKKAA